MVVPGTLFEELGIKYLGPYDGHDLPALLDIFDKNKDYNGPLLVHVITKKGKGYEPAENKPIWSHGVTPFDIGSGEVKKSDKPAPPSYTAVFAETLTELYWTVAPIPGSGEISRYQRPCLTETKYRNGSHYSSPINWGQSKK